MKIDKQKVVNNFSKAVETYEQHSAVQKICAKKTFDLIKNDFFERKHISLLEIGAGTGLFSENFIGNFDANLFLTDISRKMVERLRDRFIGKENIEFRELDGENFSLKQTFDFIVSSSVFQWFSTLEEPFFNIRKHLKNDGLFVFSMYIEGTFENLKRGYKFLGKEFLGPRFFTKEEVEKSLLNSKFKIVDIFEETFEFEFSSSLDFFKSLKKTGAIGAKNKNLSYINLKKLIAFLDSANLPFKERYKAVFVKAKSKV